MSAPLTAGVIKQRKPGWTSENLQLLLSAIKRNIPSRFAESLYTTDVKVDWHKVAFPPFSPGACRLKWRQILQKMHRGGFLPELLGEAENKPESNRGAPNNEKYKCRSQDYRERKRELREKGVEPPDNNLRRKKTEHIYGPPPRLHLSPYILFCKDQRTCMAGVHKFDYVKVWAQRWRNLTDEEKNKYQKRFQELKREHDIKMSEYLKTLNQEQQVVKSSEEVMKFAGEPKMPSQSAYLVFCKTHMALLKNEYPKAKDRLMECNRRWKVFPTVEKQSSQVRVQENLAKYTRVLQKWYQTLTPAEQKEYRESNPRKHRFIKSVIKDTEEREPLNLNRPSDSEDEDIEESSSDDDDYYYFDWNEEEEEEEEDDDITFQMY